MQIIPPQAPDARGVFLSARTKKFTEQITANITQQTTLARYVMIQLVRFNNLKCTANSPCFSIQSAIYQTFHSCVHDSADAHHTRFQRDI